MSAPRTRLDEATSDFERDMLAAWAEEQPSSRARDRALALAGGAAVAGAGAGAAPAAVGGAHLLKWIVTVTILAGGAVAAPFVLERTSSHPHPSPQAATTAASLPAAATTVAAATGTATVQAPPLEPAPMATSTAQPVAPRQATAPAPTPRPPTVMVTAPDPVPVPVVPPPVPAPDPPGGDTRSAHALGEQVALVDRARSALAAGNPSSALRLADEYDARFPGGALAPEVAGLRVEALRIRRQLDAQ